MRAQRVCSFIAASFPRPFSSPELCGSNTISPNLVGDRKCGDIQSGGHTLFRRRLSSGEKTSDGAKASGVNRNYWSATTKSDNTTNAWNVNLSNGNTNNNGKTNANNVRCVRPEMDTIFGSPGHRCLNLDLWDERIRKIKVQTVSMMRNDFSDASVGSR